METRKISCQHEQTLVNKIAMDGKSKQGVFFHSNLLVVCVAKNLMLGIQCYTGKVPIGAVLDP